jgi:hypothetical protein
MCEDLGLISHTLKRERERERERERFILWKLGVVLHSFIPSTWEAEAGR